jgi:hypothetical protein
MDAVIRKAYAVIFSRQPDPELSDWEVAESVLDSFNVPLLGEDLAKACIFRIVNHIEYPDQQTTTRVVGRAEAYAAELWDDLSDEPHMADLAVKEYEQEKTDRASVPPASKCDRK